MMNAERMIKVANAILEYKKLFNMATFGMSDSLSKLVMEDQEEPSLHNCGSVGCIAGFCYSVEYDEIYELENLTPYQLEIKLKDHTHNISSNAARDYLGITEDQANDLFYGDETWTKYRKELGYTPGCDLEDVTPEQAAKLLFNLASGEWTFYDKEVDGEECINWNQENDDYDEDDDDDDDYDDEDDYDGSDYIVEDDEEWDEDDEEVPSEVKETQLNSIILPPSLAHTYEIHLSKDSNIEMDGTLIAPPTMNINKANCQRVIDEITKDKEKFDMACFDNPLPNGQSTCGTVGCIGGFAAGLFILDHVEKIDVEGRLYGRPVDYRSSIEIFACSFLGIPYEESRKLFYVDWLNDTLWKKYSKELINDDDIHYSQVTPEVAIKMMENLISGAFIF